MPLLDTESFTFDPRPQYPFLITAKRYRLRTANYDVTPSSDAFTLIFAHGTGFHKEQWEPTLSDLWDHVGRQSGVTIREAWSVDCPNHGDAAVLNEKTLLWGYDQRFGWDEYARALHALLTGRGTGLPADYFTLHRLFGIGHSMGAVSLLLALTHAAPPVFHGLVLVEPMLVPEWGEKLVGTFLAKGAQGRRDVWESKSSAREVLGARNGFKEWDPRVLDIFCEHGLRDLPTAYYPDKTEGVTLKCSKVQEAACYLDPLGRILAYNFLQHACSAFPVHLIYGAIDDYIPAQVKDDVITRAACGKFASVRQVEGAGHLVVQTDPQGLAGALYADLLQAVTANDPKERAGPSSKL